MLFKELKSGFPVYLLNRTTMDYSQGKVTSVGMPHPDMKPSAFGKLLVDVTVQTDDGKLNTYEVSDSEQTAYAGALLIATTKECVVGEVTNFKAQAEAVLNKVDEQKKMVEKCSHLLKDLDTAYKERMATEARLDKMESTLSQILTKLDARR